MALSGKAAKSHPMDRERPVFSFSARRKRENGGFKKLPAIANGQKPPPAVNQQSGSYFPKRKKSKNFCIQMEIHVLYYIKLSAGEVPCAVSAGKTPAVLRGGCAHRTAGSAVFEASASVLYFTGWDALPCG